MEIPPKPQPKPIAVPVVHVSKNKTGHFLPPLPPTPPPPPPEPTYKTVYPFTEYSHCVYEIFNPFPNQTLFLNIYRQTNDSDIGIFFNGPRDKYYDE